MGKEGSRGNGRASRKEVGQKTEGWWKESGKEETERLEKTDGLDERKWARGNGKASEKETGQRNWRIGSTVGPRERKG